MTRARAAGPLLALAIAAAWLAAEIFGLFFFPLRGWAMAAAPLLIALTCWLNVGLFIVAHDAMHGSLQPHSPRTNLWFGRVAVALYGGFSFDRLKRAHMEHHRAPGSSGDPDFTSGDPRRLWPWYLGFMRHYFGWREFLVLTAILLACLAAGARIANLLLFWALPALLSSLQLFTFGTYLPHRHGDQAFADRHNARSNQFSWIVSLLTCFHFGYHHEHHLAPHVPWWRLPAERRRRAPVR